MTRCIKSGSPALSSRGLILAAVAIFTLSACSDSEPTSPSGSLSPTATPSFTTMSDAGDLFVEGQVLVRFRPGAARNEIAEQNRAQPREELLLERTWLLEVEPGQELEIASNLSKNPNVEFAEPNYVYSVIPCGIGDCTAPTDVLFGAKWDLHNPGFVANVAGVQVAPTGQEGADIAWLEAFEYLQNSDITPQAAVLGVIDTGIRATHQDLAGKVIAGRNYCPSLFCLIGTVNAGNWADDNGHGTHVASTAAGHGNDGIGVPGVAFLPDVQLLAVKVCGGPLGLCNAAGVANGIIWAVDNGAHVLNLSLGGGAPSAAQQSALAYALNNNVLPVCASGNDPNFQGLPVSYPAAFPECMAVGASNWSDERSSFSNFGPEVEVAAPGGDVSEHQPHSLILAGWYTANDAYAYSAGTSMAAPQVAGLAALLRATGMTSAADIRARIRATADDLGPEGFDHEFGDGRINVYRALTQIDPFIAMDISTRSVVNLGAQGQVQIVLLAREAETFGLDMLVLESVAFAGAPLAARPNGTLFATWSDVDGDGLDDLIFHFSVTALRAAGVTPGTTQANLTATLTDGRRLQATVAVSMR